MDSLLVLTHRMPFPPNRGDKIRTYNLLRGLSQYFEIHLGTFYDTPEDKQFVDSVAQFVHRVHAVPVSLSVFSKVRHLARAIFKRQTITTQFFRSSSMTNWIENTVAKYNPKTSLFFCSSTAPYSKLLPTDTRKIIDLIDLDSDKWHQMSADSSWPMSWLYRREHQKLSQLEQQITQDFDSVIFVSDEDKALLNQMVPKALQSKSVSLANGVDLEYFDPNQMPKAPKVVSSNQQQSIVFTGTLDARANIASILWFCQCVWPEIKKQQPDLNLYIVGKRPTRSIQNLQQLPGIKVCADVPDIRPFLLNCTLAIAPMTIARGIQNKVLEAMAMGKALVLTTKAAEGIDLPTSQSKYVASNAEQFIDQIQSLLSDAENRNQIAQDNRQSVRTHCNWSDKTAVLKQIIEAGNVS